MLHPCLCLGLPNPPHPRPQVPPALPPTVSVPNRTSTMSLRPLPTLTRSLFRSLVLTLALATRLLTAAPLADSNTEVGDKPLVAAATADTTPAAVTPVVAPAANEWPSTPVPATTANAVASPASSIDAPVSPGALPQVYALLNYLNSVKGTAMLAGQHTTVKWEGTDAWDIPTAELAWLQANTGKLPAVRGFDFMFLNDPQCVDSGTGLPLQKIARDALRWHRAGGIVTIHWHWKMGTFTSNRSLFNFYVMNGSVPATDWDLAKGLTPGTPENTKFNTDMDAVAAELKVLRDAGVPVIWRPFHECSGNWFWWSAWYNPATARVEKRPELFKQAWRYMFDRLTRVHGLTNLLWEYNPNEGAGEVAAWYPGDEYVDMISVDVYPSNGTHPTYASTYASFNALTGGRKVVAMSENGAIPDPDNAHAEGAAWSYFATWSGDFLMKATASGVAADSLSVANNLNFIKRVYAHERVITLDELPALFGPANDRIVNISTRGPVGLTAQPMIGGFVIKGSQHKRILLRAAGPALSFFGVPDTLADPILELYDGSNTLIASNDNWGSDTATAAALTQAFADTGAFDQLTLGGSPVDTWPDASKDAALLLILPPGNYTAQIKPRTPGQSGTAMIEIYDADLASSGSTLVNISTLCDVRSPAANPVAGFISKGRSRRVLVRGAGPALAAFGVSPLLTDPALLLQQAGTGTTLASNDDWASDTALRNAFAATGAFDAYTDQGQARNFWSANSKDAAFTTTLDGGSFTATLSGPADNTGRAILEIYDYP